MPSCEPQRRSESFRFAQPAAGPSIERVHALSAIDPWFLATAALLQQEQALLQGRLEGLGAEALLGLKPGYSDRQIAWCTGSDELAVRPTGKGWANAVFKTVDLRR